MGIPLVGRRRQRETLTPQAADWGCGNISKRICGVCGSGRSSINHQQWKQVQKPTANHNQYSLGALLSRGIATQGFVHARLLQYVRKELDCAPLGKYAVGPDQDSGSRAVAAGNRGRKWNQGQNQVRDVGFVFPCGSLGVLWPQPDLLRHSGRKWRKERTKYGSACQCQAPKVAVEIDGRASGAGSDRARVPGSASRVSGCRTGNTSRRTRRTPLDGLRFQQSRFRHPAFLLLASGRAPHRYKSEASAQKLPMHPGLKDGLLEWRSQSLYNQPEDFVFPSERLKGRKPLDLAAVLKKKIQPAFKRIGISGVGWHTFRHTVGTMLAEMGEHHYDPRLLAAQQPPCHEQVPAGDIEDQASGTRQVGRRLLACGLVAQTEPGPIGDAKQRIRILEFAPCAYRPRQYPLVRLDQGL